MGIDVLGLGEEQPKYASLAPLTLETLAKPAFQTHVVENPRLAVWMMSVMPNKTVFPWFGYNVNIDEDLQSLNELWQVTNVQCFLDCLFLSHLKKWSSGSTFYAVIPGNVKRESWRSLRPADQEVFSRGQSCVFRLEGSISTKLAVNWVPFWEPQSLTREPQFGNFWRLFLAARPEETANSICFFALSDPKKLPQVINLLIQKNDHRSELLSHLVDWFGLYTSPLDERHGTACVLYTQHNEVAERLKDLQFQFKATVEQAQRELLASPQPRTALRILSRHVAL